MQIPSKYFQTNDYQFENKLLIGLDVQDMIEIYKLSDYLDDYYRINIQYPPLKTDWTFGLARFSKRLALSYLQKGSGLTEHADICSWDINTGNLVRIWSLGDEYIDCFRILEDRELIITGHSTNVRLWDHKMSNALIHILDHPFENETLAVGISNTAIGCSGDEGYKLWDLRRLDFPIHVSNDFITQECPTFDMNDLFIAAADQTGKLELLLNSSKFDKMRLELANEVTNLCLDERRMVFYDKKGFLQVYDFLVPAI
jgi:WD40 repeat protein